MPHCTLTGFFHDDPAAVGIYCAALEAALGRARPHQPPVALSILRMELQEQFHGLLLDSPWLKALIADFTRSVDSPTRRDALRLKNWLHLSLAYAFPPQQHEPLAILARELVNPQAPVGWELRFYERAVSGAWICHSSWPL
jgi:ubiquitin-associated SH3 domain-containing protein